MSVWAREKCRWTVKDRDTLLMMWGHHPQGEIAKALQRSPRAVFIRARGMGIGGACPQGFESLQRAADRCGFQVDTMRRVLNAARVKIRPAPTLLGNSYHVLLEPSAVDAAVAAWCRLETLQQAGRRLRMDASVIRRHLLAAEARGEITLPPHSRGSYWRVPRETIDLAFSIWEDGKEAATRIGVSWNTLRKWLYEAGVVRPAGRQWRVRRADVNAICDAKRAANSKAFRKVTPAIVREIRARRGRGESYPSLAAEFGITRAAARFIAIGLTWKHVPFESKGIA